MTQLTEQGQERRAELLRLLLRTPHGDYRSLYDAVLNVASSDPRFYAHFVSWLYAGKNYVRDQVVVHTALCLTGIPDENPRFEEAVRELLRPVGLHMLYSEKVRMMARIVRFIKGARYSTFFGKPRNPHWENPRSRAFVTEQARIDAEWERLKDSSYGLYRNVPHSAKVDITKNLRDLEADVDQWNKVTMNNKADMQYLYATLRIPPGNAYFDYVLFPAGKPIPTQNGIPDWWTSPFAAIKELARRDDDDMPIEAKALAIVDNDIPYLVATSLIGKSPTAMIALLNQMSPQQVINVLAQLERDGLRDNPDTAKIINEKLKQAKSDERVTQSITRARSAESQVVDTETKKALRDVREAQVQKVVQINDPVLMLIDVSGSLRDAIHLSRELAPLISDACTAEFMALSFDTQVEKLDTSSRDRLDRDFQLLQAGGGTDIGAPFYVAQRQGFRAGKIIMITDQDENSGHYITHGFRRAMPEYLEWLGYEPGFIVVQVGHARRGNFVVDSAREFGLDPILLDANQSDGYSHTQALRLLSAPGMFDLVQEIMDAPLLERLG